MDSKAKKLTSADRVLLNSLKRKYFYFKKKGMLNKDGSFYYDDKRLAYEEFISESTVKRSKCRLIDFELIKIEKGKYKGTATLYWILEKGIKMTSFRSQERPSNCSIKGVNLAFKGYQNDTPNIVNNVDINTNHVYLPLSYLEEIFNTNNKDKLDTRNYLLKIGFTEFQIEETFRKLNK